VFGCTSYNGQFTYTWSFITPGKQYFVTFGNFTPYSSGFYVMTVTSPSQNYTTSTNPMPGLIIETPANVTLQSFYSGSPFGTGFKAVYNGRKFEAFKFLL
jgi:hypothetical protein